MQDTSGFYKEDQGVLLFGPNGVLGPEYALEREFHDQYTYPINGWYWFDTEADARAFFGILV